MNAEKIIEECVGCENINNDDTCRVYLMTTRQWTGRRCAMRTHKREVVDAVTTWRLDPLKASKRKAKGKV